MKPYRLHCILASLLALVVLTGCWSDDKEPEPAADFGSTTGVVSYSGYAPLSSRPVKVHYYIPAKGDRATMPVLFVLPGQERNAADYLASWRQAADRRHFMVFALEFPADAYSSSQYIEGGMFSGGSLVAPEKRTFAVIEPLFDYIRQCVGSRVDSYDLWGHSAGAQFVHRFVTFTPGIRVNRAVCANAGWYTLPDPGVTYPYGLKGSGSDDEATLRRLFATELIVQLGTADTGRDGLNTTAGAEAQGRNRFERGNFYFNTAEATASAHGITLCWMRREVPGVGHDQARMAADAATMMY